jgi:hypothetical protein
MAGSAETQHAERLSFASRGCVGRRMAVGGSATGSASRIAAASGPSASTRYGQSGSFDWTRGRIGRLDVPAGAMALACARAEASRRLAASLQAISFDITPFTVPSEAFYRRDRNRLGQHVAYQVTHDCGAAHEMCA